MDTSAKITRILPEEERVTSDRLTRFETAQIIGILADQIDHGMPYPPDVSGETSLEIAEKLFLERKVPFRIERRHLNGRVEIVDPNLMLQPKL